MSKIKTAMILAAGRGVRMRELTDTKPKPLIEVCQKPIIHYIVEKMQVHPINKIVVNTCYKGDMIKTALADYDNIVFSDEETALETGGGVKKALPLLQDEVFFVSNADPVWLDNSTSVFQQLEDSWNPDETDILLALIPTQNAKGDVKDGNYFIENNKPRRRRVGEKNIPYLFMGIQIIHSRIFKNVTNTVFSLRDLYDEAERNNRLGYIIFDGKWYHVGTPEALQQTETDLTRDFECLPH